MQAFFANRFDRAKPSERDTVHFKRLLVLTTSSNKDIYKQRMAAEGSDCPWISIWRLDIPDRREFELFKELAIPAAEPKLGNKQYWILSEHLCAPESSAESAVETAAGTAAAPTSAT